MAEGYVLYNDRAGNGKYKDLLDALQVVFDRPLRFLDVTQITNYAAFLSGLEAEDVLILAGGDGTLNCFINNTEGLTVPCEILYFPLGTGNDFAQDLGKERGAQPFPINQYLRDLPKVTVNGKTCRFLNGVGFGIDGYCCQVGDELRKIPGKKVNYTLIAIKGLLLHFKPVRATVTVDGRKRVFEKVWIAPTMNGRFYGGGMMPTPNQDRQGGKLSAMVFHDSGKLKTLMIFPSLFKGEHVRHKKYITVLEGEEITVEFDRPTPLQIDGETVLNVTAYTAVTAKVSAPV